MRYHSKICVVSCQQSTRDGFSLDHYVIPCLLCPHWLLILYLPLLCLFYWLSCTMPVQNFWALPRKGQCINTNYYYCYYYYYCWIDNWKNFNQDRSNSTQSVKHAAGLEYAISTTAAGTPLESTTTFHKWIWINWLKNSLTDQMTDWLIDRLIDWLTDWLIAWLIKWLIDWLMTDWLTVWLTNDWWLTDQTSPQVLEHLLYTPL